MSERPRGSRAALAERSLRWSNVEVWTSWPLRWADRTSRSLLLVALAIGGLLSCYGLTLLLHRPPELVPSIVLRAIGTALLALAILAAPASRGYRVGAAYCLLMFMLASGVVVAMESTNAFGATTYGALAAIELIAFGALVVAWLLVRMRHPLTILISVVAYGAASGSFLVRVVPALRSRLFDDPWQERLSNLDETILRAAMVLICLGIVLLAWWLDGWMRALLPVANVAEPHGSGRASRTGEGARIRGAVITMLVGLDLVALAIAISAKQPQPRGRLSVDDDWWASVVITVATARTTMVLIVIAAAIVWLSDPARRAG